MHLQVDDLKVSVEDELGRRFGLPPPAGPDALRAALALASRHVHSSSRLLHLAVRHVMGRPWAMLASCEAVAAAVAHEEALRPAVLSEVRRGVACRSRRVPVRQAEGGRGTGRVCACVPGTKPAVGAWQLVWHCCWCDCGQQGRFCLHRGARAAVPGRRVWPQSPGGVHV